MLTGKLVREHMPFVDAGLLFIVQPAFKFILGDPVASVHRCWDYKYRSLGLARSLSFLYKIDRFLVQGSLP